jgi:hypothetical protein
LSRSGCERRGTIVVIKAVILTLIFALSARAEWVKVPPVRQTGYGGVLGEIEDRLSGPTKYTGRARVLWAHENTHVLNDRIGGQQRAFYVHGGYALRVPWSGHTVRQVAATVPRQYRPARLFGLYMVQLGSNPVLVLFDELSAYTCDVVDGLQSGRSVRWEWTTAKWFVYWCSCATVYLRDRGYSHWRELNQFVLLTQQYLKTLVGMVR